MPDVDALCCPECKEKSTLSNQKLISKNYELRGGSNSRFGSAVEEGEMHSYYRCKRCKNEWAKSELEKMESGWTTVSWIDPGTGEQVFRRQKKGTQMGGKKRNGESYWKKQDSLLKKLREK